ncbi:MAG UNVERIFIED_CONTAM: hypothetical protein LVR18_36650 [Planctomycetaceae bacterium]|jgi:hypothetical protein
MLHGATGFCNIGDGQIFDAKGKLTWEYPKAEGGKRKNLHDGWQQEHHDLFASIRKGDIPAEGEVWCVQQHDVDSGADGHVLWP